MLHSPTAQNCASGFREGRDRQRYADRITDALGGFRLTTNMNVITKLVGVYNLVNESRECVALSGLMPVHARERLPKPMGMRYASRLC